MTAPSFKPKNVSSSKHTRGKLNARTRKVPGANSAKGKLTRQERRALRIKSKKHSQVVKKILPLWEVLRRDDTPKEKRLDIVDQIIKECQKKVSDLCFAHDTARVMESIIQHGTELQRWTVFSEIRCTLRLMAKSLYGKFVLMKLIKYGAKEHRLEILKVFRGHVARLVNHRIAAEVVDMIYNDYANATQRGALIRELYGNVHALKLVENDIHTLVDALSFNPDKRQTILGNVNALLISLASKGLCKYAIVQHLLLEYLQVVQPTLTAHESTVMEVDKPDPGQLTFEDSFFTLCETLVQNQVVPMLHTREGVRAALYLLWAASPRLRKLLVRSLKTCVSSIARNEHGHLFLIGVLDCVDDIVLLEKVLIKEILEDLRLFCVHPECRKVLLYALSPRDKRHFSPQLQSSLFHAGDTNPYTKKSLGVRVLELRNPRLGLLPRLLQLISTNLKDVFVGDSTPDGRLAFLDRGRLILLAEILIRCAPHHLDPTNVASAYTRGSSHSSCASSASEDVLSCPINTTDLNELQTLRRDALLKVAHQLLVPVFAPVRQTKNPSLDKRTHSRDDERVKRHKRAVSLVEQSISASGKPNFSLFELNDDNKADCSSKSIGFPDNDSVDSAYDVPFLERPEGTLFIRRLLQDGRLYKDFTFARLIMEHVPPSNLCAWMRCNRSCFVLVNLYESGDRTICELIRSALAPYLTELSISPLPGAKILYKHLTSVE